MLSLVDKRKVISFASSGHSFAVTSLYALKVTALFWSRIVDLFFTIFYPESYESIDNFTCFLVALKS